MDTIGLDLHKRESQLCIIGSQGEITEKRIVTTRERFTAVLLGGSLPDSPRGIDGERVGSQTSGIAGTRGHSCRSGVRSDVRYAIQKGEDRQA